jgi:hypothetical protein
VTEVKNWERGMDQEETRICGTTKLAGPPFTLDGSVTSLLVDDTTRVLRCPEVWTSPSAER